jgi:hypothetical protein
MEFLYTQTVVQALKIILIEITNTMSKPKIDNKTRNKGGRKTIESPLEIVIPARFTLVEYENLTTKTKLLKISKSAYVRSMTLNGTVKSTFTEEELYVKKQLIGMANNLNQLLKMANTYGLENVTTTVVYQLNEIDKILAKFKNGSGRK